MSAFLKIRKMKWNKRNLGFSLIELIVVVAIIAIVSTGGVMAISTINEADALRVATNIDTAMTKVRTETMSKEDKQYLYLYMIGNTLYMKQSRSTETSTLDAATGTKIASRVTLAYSNNGTTADTLVEGSPLCIGFLRSSGAFDSPIKYLTLSSADKAYVLTCVTETGKHWVE